MKTHKILGFILISLSVLFFGFFIWWGTTQYKSGFGVGIILVAIGTFVGGLHVIYTPIK